MASHYISKDSFKDNPLLSRLLTLHDAPLGIYVQGELPSIHIDAFGRATPRILTIVGSRKCTTYGKRALETLLESFSSDEVIIVSGLALGIDGKAHELALKHTIPTIAVPGSGLHERVLYPQTNLPLARQIIKQKGVLISELKDEERATQWSFPKRNRIMAALSDAVLIVEAEEKSGTLITARLALELGKDIGALPGDIFSQTAAGTLSLIRDGATPIMTHNDLRALLHLQEKEISKRENISLTQDEELILSLLNEAKDKDTLLEESGLPFSVFMSTLTTLEMKNYIEDVFGEVKKIV